MSTRIICPHCGTNYSFEGELPKGRGLRCKKCGKGFPVSDGAKTKLTTDVAPAAAVDSAPATSAPADSAPQDADAAPEPAAESEPDVTLPETPLPSVPDATVMKTPAPSADTTMPKTPRTQQETVRKTPSPAATGAGMTSVGNSRRSMSGQIIGGCRIEQKIGQGGMGAVYKAHHINLDIPVAVKFLPPQFEMADPVFRARFIREARAAAKLQHQNVVNVMNVGKDKGVYFIIMQYVDGESLEDKLVREGRVAPTESLEIMRQLCEALKAAHARGIIHRDIKPDNVMLSKDGTVKLADLGLAKNLEDQSHVTESGMGMGTPYYMSPEQAADATQVDARSDLYSLGCTWYRAVTGKVPYDGPSNFLILTKHTSAPIPEPRVLAPDLPEGQSNVIKRTMAKKPEERPQSAAELLDAIVAMKHGAQTAMAMPPLVAPPLTVPPDPTQVFPTGASGTGYMFSSPGMHAPGMSPGKKWAMIFGAAVVLLGLVATIVGILVLGGNKPEPPPAVRRTRPATAGTSGTTAARTGTGTAKTKTPSTTSTPKTTPKSKTTPKTTPQPKPDVVEPTTVPKRDLPERPDRPMSGPDDAGRADLPETAVPVLSQAVIAKLGQPSGDFDLKEWRFIAGEPRGDLEFSPVSDISFSLKNGLLTAKNTSDEHVGFLVYTQKPLRGAFTLTLKVQGAPAVGILPKDEMERPLHIELSGGPGPSRPGATSGGRPRPGGRRRPGAGSGPPEIDNTVHTVVIKRQNGQATYHVDGKDASSSLMGDDNTNGYFWIALPKFQTVKVTRFKLVVH